VDRPGFDPGDLQRAPGPLGITSGAQLASVLDRLTSEGLKLAVALDAAPGRRPRTGRVRLANGQSAFQAPGAGLYATPGIATRAHLVGATAPTVPPR